MNAVVIVGILILSLIVLIAVYIAARVLDIRWRQNNERVVQPSQLRRPPNVRHARAPGLTDHLPPLLPPIPSHPPLIRGWDPNSQANCIASLLLLKQETISTACPICYEEYSVMMPAIKPEPCQHSLCSLCHIHILEYAERKHVTPLCPYCRVPYSRAHSVIPGRPESSRASPHHSA
ncbi:uncharacterized protein EI90DRAFT_520812 [Cantharellus anzutake]|uniref:uncharacterized protein n=1 Tax=Cantharellus anzutake TaxID=1750568 RepID=UPI001902E014|nr:uncharacterized protein EI90DRAFT_520812 [Cantharellus anzutake]KAF8334177.1 hypothetical protein EI90DRAFT_520812 [Cantharellus anzutake]